MKRALIILALFVIGYDHAIAQCLLKVSLTNRQVINVAVDGRYFNKRGTSVTIGDLPPGNHYMQVYGIERKRNGKLREAVIYESIRLHCSCGLASRRDGSRRTGRAD